VQHDDATADQIGHLLTCERREREQAALARDQAVRDTHIMLADRYADRAWALAEQGDAAYIPSGLWPASGASLSLAQ